MTLRVQIWSLNLTIIKSGTSITNKINLIVKLKFNAEDVVSIQFLLNIARDVKMFIIVVSYVR